MTAEPQPWMRDAAERISRQLVLDLTDHQISRIAALIATAHASAPSASAAAGGALLTELDAVLKEIEIGDKPDPGDVHDLLAGYRRLLLASSPSAPGDVRAELIDAAQALHDDIADYARINNLGGYDNHCMKRIRAAISAALARPAASAGVGEEK